MKVAEKGRDASPNVKTLAEKGARTGTLRERESRSIRVTLELPLPSNNRCTYVRSSGISQRAGALVDS